MTPSRPGSESFRTRAARFLRPSTAAADDGRPSPPSNTRPYSRTSAISPGGPSNEKESPSASSEPPPESSSLSSNEKTLTASKDGAAAEHKDNKRLVHPIPPWVHSGTEDDENLDPTKHLLPRPPGLAQPSQHNYMPAPKKGAYPGRAFDYKRDREPALISRPVAECGPRWKAFVDESAYPHSLSEKGEVVGEEWMRLNMPDLEGPWAPGIHPEEKRMKKLRRRIENTILKSPFVPLVIRLIVLTFSAVALGVSGSIWKMSNAVDAHAVNATTPVNAANAVNATNAADDVTMRGCKQQSSSILAICFNAVALFYILYITYDEYTSKPLGLRPAGAKMRLIFLDLFFIVFDAATVSLAFNTLSDPRWACYDSDASRRETCPQDNDICSSQAALVSILLVSLIAWLLTFSISTLRLIDRVVQRTPD